VAPSTPFSSTSFRTVRQAENVGRKRRCSRPSWSAHPRIRQESPFLALGTHDEIAEHLLACRNRWGISYYVVRDIEAFAPVIDALRREDRLS